MTDRRVSCAGAGGGAASSGPPQKPQNLNCSGISPPQAGQAITAYLLGRLRAATTAAATPGVSLSVLSTRS